MLSLFDTSTKTLPKETVQIIFELLKISPAPDITDFLNDPDENDFHALFFGVLIENDIPCALDIDWKWHPEDLFWQLERAGDTIKLIDSEWIQSSESYRIECEVDNQPKVITVPFDNPGELLDATSQYMGDDTFIAINFLEDRYSWLIVPKDFDTDLFCRLTGLTTELPSLKQAIPENFAEGYKQIEKIFFRPSLIYVDENQAEHAIPGNPWAGRILPGQTIKEGIAAELKTELNYSGRFDYSYDGFEGIFKDRNGDDIERYNVTVYLYDKTFQSRMLGDKL